VGLRRSLAPKRRDLASCPLCSFSLFRLRGHHLAIRFKERLFASIAVLLFSRYYSIRGYADRFHCCVVSFFCSCLAAQLLTCTFHVEISRTSNATSSYWYFTFLPPLITVFRIHTKQIKIFLTDMVMNLTEIRNTRMLASSSLDGDICLWDTHTLALTQRLKGHLKGVLATDYSADFRILVSCGFDRDALVWNPMVFFLFFSFFYLLLF
jgi:WD40 repeat protein